MTDSSPSPNLTLRDASGYERALVQAVDAEGREIAILFKGRDELPDIGFDALTRGYGPITHLGQPPKFQPAGADCEAAYAAWTQQSGAASGTPLVIVDASPIGVAELASVLSGDPQWRGLADAMRVGTYDDRALKLTDAVSAMACLDPTARGAISAAAAAQTAHRDQQLRRAAAALDAVLRGEVTPEVASWETEASEWFGRTGSQVQFGDAASLDPAVRDHWLDRIDALAASGAIDALASDIEKTVGTEFGLDHALRSALGQVLLHLDHRLRTPHVRDDGTTDLAGITEHLPHNWFTEAHDPAAFLTVAQALAGDGVAGAEVREAVAMLAEHDAFIASQRAAARHPYGPGRAPTEVADPATLTLVHCTSFEPTRAADGSVVLGTRFDTTGYGRSTLHFTLNHVVESHMYGQWDDAGFVVLAPYQAAVDTNGLPANLLGVDTWWERNPGALVTLPGAVVVEMDPHAATLVTRRGDDITVKSAGYTEADLRVLADEYGIDLAKIEGIVRDQVERGLRSVDDAPRFRESLIAGDLRASVTGDVIRSFGGPVLQGGDWATNNEEPIAALAEQLDLPHTAHSNTAAHSAEGTTARYLDPDGYAQVGTLVEAGPVARRVAIAAGVAGPEPVRVVERGPVGLESVVLG